MHKKIQKIGRCFAIFEMSTLICDYSMHERSRICHPLYKMYYFHIKHPLFLYFINMIFPDCFQSVPCLSASLLIFFINSLYAKLIFFQVKHFSKIISLHTSIFVSNENILIAASLLRFEKIRLINQFVNKSILSFS